MPYQFGIVWESSAQVFSTVIPPQYIPMRWFFYQECRRCAVGGDWFVEAVFGEAAQYQLLWGSAERASAEQYNHFLSRVNILPFWIWFIGEHLVNEGGVLSRPLFFYLVSVFGLRETCFHVSRQNKRKTIAWNHSFCVSIAFYCYGQPI